MIKILEQCPITWNGDDRIELKVEDPDLFGDVCSHCCYHDYVPDDDLEATCMDVHCCGYSEYVYFIIA